MRAVRLVGMGEAAQIEDVAKPSPGPGQVVVKIGGEGVRHSDLHVMEEDLVYDKFKAGQITGRAVLIPDGA